jgi:polar amino acid transport system substrate-binding protein
MIEPPDTMMAASYRYSLTRLQRAETIDGVAFGEQREGKPMRTRNLLASALAAGLALTACGSSAKTSTAGKIDNCDVSGVAGSIKLTPVTADTLTIQTSLPAPGWFNGDTADVVKDGYEYCMAANVAYRAGLHHVKLSSVDFDQLVAGSTSAFDMALAEISITDKRKQVVDFSVPYFASDIGVLVAKDTVVKSTADLKKLTIGVQQATTGGDFAAKNINPNVKVYPDAATMFAALQSGAVQAAMTDTSIVQEQEKKANGDLKVVGQYKTGESYGALYPKGSSNEKQLDKAIQSLIDDKTLNKLATKYLSGDPASVPFFTV